MNQTLKDQILEACATARENDVKLETILICPNHIAQLDGISLEDLEKETDTNVVESMNYYTIIEGKYKDQYVHYTIF